MNVKQAHLNCGKSNGFGGSSVRTGRGLVTATVDGQTGKQILYLNGKPVVESP
jgi:hypothetical protein